MQKNVRLLIVLGAIACGGTFASGQKSVIAEQEKREELSARETTLVNNIAAALKGRYDIPWERVSADVRYPEWRLSLIKLPVRSIDSSFIDVGKENAFTISSKFLSDNAEVLGLAEVEFAESRVFGNQVKGKIYSNEVTCHMNVNYEGVEIFGARVTTVFADSFLVRVSLSVETRNLPAVEPTIDRDSAFRIASKLATKRTEDLKPIIGRQDNMFGNPARSAEEMELDKGRLLIYSTRIFGEDGLPRLMWELTISGKEPESFGASGTYFIDAHSGEFLWRSSGRIR